MSVIRIGPHFFRVAKIAYLDVTKAGLFGNKYNLLVVYDMPVVTDTDYVPMAHFVIQYDQENMKALYDNVKYITATNHDCLLGTGVTHLMDRQKRE